MSERLIIVGAGGLGREVWQYALDENRAGRTLAGFLDDRPAGSLEIAPEGPVIGTVKHFQPQQDDRVVIAVGDPVARARIARVLAAAGARFGSVIHPTAWVAPSAKLGEGAIVAPFAFVGVGAEVGPHAILNVYASVGHDSRAGGCVTLSPYASTNGGTRLGECVFLGAHAATAAALEVGAFSKISAGAVAYRAVAAGSLVTGNPATGRVMFPTALS